MEGRPGCDTQLKLAIDVIGKTESIEYVIIAGYNGFVGLANSEPGREYLNGFKRTVAELKNRNKKVVFVIDNPTFKESAELCAPKALKAIELLNRSYPDFCANARKTDLTPRAEYNKFIDMMRMEMPDIYFYDSYPLFCKNNVCRLFDGSKLLYGDYNHLSIYGSQTLADDLVKKSDEGRILTRLRIMPHCGSCVKHRLPLRVPFASGEQCGLAQCLLRLVRDSKINLSRQLDLPNRPFESGIASLL